MSKYKVNDCADYTVDLMSLHDQKTSLVAVNNINKDHVSKAEEEDAQVSKKGKSRRYKCVQGLKNNLFLLLTFAGIFIGLIIGIAVRPSRPGPDTLIWIGMPGDLYMRVLQAMILPLIFCTVIDGTANTDPRSNGRIGLVTMAYILITNALGGIVGIALCLAIRPGATRADEDDGGASPDTRNLQTVDIFADFIRNIFPDNIVAAAMQMYQTKYSSKEVLVQRNISGLLVNETSVKLVKSLSTVGGTNILGLIVISAAIGIAASQTRHKTQPFIDFFKAGAIVIFKLFSWVKWATPIGVASLIAVALAKVANIASAFSSMGMFILTTSGGCLLYQAIVLPTILVVFTRRNPFTFIKHAAKPMLLGFGPAVSTIPLPEMIRVAEEVYKVDPRVAGFTLPFCTTLNRDCSCLFITATCLFIAQYTRTELGTGDIFTLGVLAFMSSLAVPAVPSSSVVAILIILGSMGISTHNIGLVMAVEWLNDRVRTTTNVMSHMVGVLVTWRHCRASLEKTNKIEDQVINVKEPEAEA